ncbi:MAG: IS1634 family transposase [Clostridia bacterium]|nr:IS1634 family transposase [Clostridia bacterium]
MRIRATKTKNTIQYAIIRDINKNGKRTTCVYENIGNLEKLKKRAGDMGPLEWLNNYVQKLNEQNKAETLPVIILKNPNKIIEKNIQNCFNIGYLFLQDIYYKLKLDDICKQISDKHQFKFDLNNILSNLIYSRIIYPASKLKTLELSKKFLEQPNFDYQHIERALAIICEKMDFIQSELYKNSCKYMERNNKVLYYDCTNYYFEIEEESGLRQYGKSKENRPNPIVQMGLFMDGDGIPLIFDITPGNTNEQVTLTPLEEKIIKDFNTSEFVVCTDAGLASTANRKFNNINNRKFVTTQSIKKLKKHLKEEALDLSSGWHLTGSKKSYNISKLRTDEKLIEQYKDKIFYKERWIKEGELEQRLIVTYSVKYQEYQKNIRNTQLNRAKKIIEENPQKLSKAKQNDSKRFIKTTNVTNDGEVAEKSIYAIDQNIVDEEAKYDGLYAVCTNLEDPVEEIMEINHRRWEIEESFRIMKSDFKSRPVYHSKNETIKAHFITCFLSLIIYRYLEKKLDEKYTAPEIIETLRNMEIKQENHDSFSPNYIRTDLTDDLHEKFGFRTDFEVMNIKKYKKIFNQTKK